jgi:hypothetical protein
MQKAEPALSRALHTEKLSCDLAVAGGGLAGVCAAINAARAGLKVVLVQDRPVLGGNASSEVRLWTLGATAHMHAPNRWAREGGVIDEILVENQFRNPEGNALFFDTVLLEKVVEEPNITLLLNTAVYEVEKSDPDTISGLRAFCSQNSTQYEISAPLFCDASGDGIVGFLAGAAFRMGAESSEEFGEKFAPSKEYGELLGHSIYFYTKDLGRPVKYTPPSYALKDIEGSIPRYRGFSPNADGCRLWWIEYGGRLDTVHDTEKIKWELWSVVFGVWNYIKNSGKFPEAENLTLEWVGHVPGKRESRRFEGDYILKQQDVIEQRHFEDAVAFGGWALDLHPADGVYSKLPGCTHWRMRGMYGIPYRTLYSRNINNLFLGGRIMSVTHAAYGSTRVMATLAHCGQAIGLAAALCIREKLLPREVNERTTELQTALLRTGQHIPGFALNDRRDLAKSATITASSTYELAALPYDGKASLLDAPRGQLLPLPAGKVPQITLFADVIEATTVELSLRVSARAENHDLNEILGTRSVQLEPGENIPLVFDLDATLDEAKYGLFAVSKNAAVSLRTSDQRLTGVLAMRFSYRQDPNGGKDSRGESSTPNDIGVETFDIWLPERRPNGRNFALMAEPALQVFQPENVTNGIQRPTNTANAWLAALEDEAPTLTVSWPEPKTVSRVELFFDTDYDHPMETVLWGHPENAIPFCVRHFRVKDGNSVLAEVTDNHQSRQTVTFDPIQTNSLQVELVESWGETPKALFEVRVYE